MAKEFVPCIPKYLPAEMVEMAAMEAIAINPLNAPAIEPLMAALGDAALIAPPTPQSLAYLTGKAWPTTGKKLTVGFMEQTPVDLQNRILKYLNFWYAHDKLGPICNIEFVLSNTDPIIRISRERKEYWSYLGTDILQIPKNQPTMMLGGITMQTPDAECRRVIPHEGGHSLSFPHEQQLPQIVRKLHEQRTIAWAKRVLGWGEAMARNQILTPLGQRTFRMTSNADTSGAMCYGLPAEITIDNIAIPGGTDIDAIDAAFAASIYPLTVQPPPPPPPPPPTGTSDFDLSINIASKTVSIRLPAGWTVTRKPAQQIGETMNQEHDCKHMATLADELEAALPTRAPDDSGAIALGGILTSVLALITALRAGDWKAVALALRDVLNTIFGGNGGTIEFQAPGVDMGKLTSVIAKIS